MSPIPADLPGGLLATLRARHSGAGRDYHGWDHVLALLGHLDAERDRVADPRTLAFAILYHDAVYDPRRGDNEERSAALALSELADLLDPPAAVRLERAILATKGHRVPADLDLFEGYDIARFLDWDIAILGAEREAYDAYEAAIRREYAHVPEAAYRAGRAAVLGSFLARDPIYRTEHSRGRLEARARANLARAIAALAAAEPGPGIPAPGA